MVGRTPLQRLLGNIGLYGAVFLYVAFALLPIYWTVKISVTPENLLYSEGIRLWPSRVTLANYAQRAESHAIFRAIFLNSLIVSLSTALIVTVVASLAGYALSRFRFRGKAWVSLVLLLTQTFPLVMVIPPIFRIMGQLGPDRQSLWPHRHLHRVQHRLCHLPHAVLLRWRAQGSRRGRDDRRLHQGHGARGASSCR